MARTPLFSGLSALVARDHRASLRASSASISRRGLVAGAAALAACSSQSEDPVIPVMPNQHRIAVVGGGLAGLTCAYFLKLAEVPAVVYEASDRVGGRAFTLRNDLPEELRCELGAEHFDSRHAGLRVLAAELEVALETRSFARERCGYWALGKAIPEPTVAADLQRVIPRLQRALESAEVSTAATAALDSTPLSTFLDLHVPRDDFPELAALLDVAFRAEFGIEVDRQSSVNAAHLFDEANGSAWLGASVWLRARDGSDRFAARISALLGDSVVLDSRLRSVRTSGTSYVLGFENSRGIGSESEVERVVFALPFRVLDRVDLARAGLSMDKRVLIRDLQYGSHSVAVGAFERSETDAERVLCDLAFQLAWRSGETATLQLVKNVLSGRAGLAPAVTADEHLRAIRADLEQTFGGPLVYLNGSARRVDWAAAPSFLGSISSPAWGQWQRQLAAGRPEGLLHFCGEHTSVDFRGTLEGAVETGAFTAAQILLDRGVRLPLVLERLLELKRDQPQPHFRETRWELPRPLSRRRAVLESHAEFVATIR